MSASDNIIRELLGGAKRKRTRVRGFADWNPSEESLALLDLIRQVLAEYAHYLPLTIRQIFYRLVGAHGYDKTELAYERLCERINRARRARLIDMDDIRDDGGVMLKPSYWSGADQFLSSVRYAGAHLRLDRQLGQQKELLLVCEAAGMAPQIQRVADPFGITVRSGGGFDSTTDQHSTARAIAASGYPTEMLHIGDLDPSGAHLCLAWLENVEAFTREYGGEVTTTRLAVTRQQVRELRLETSPPKPTDNRAFEGPACQAEAIPPDVLARIVREAIESRIDWGAYDAVLRREKRQRAKIRRSIGAAR